MSREPVTPSAEIAPTSAPSSLARFGPALPVAGIAVAGAVGVVLLNTVTLPAFVATHGIAVAIAVAGGIVAVRWVRRGVRAQLRSGAAAKVAEFGGGIYGSIAFATLLYLEVVDLVADVASAGSLWAFVGSLSLGWLIGQLLESVRFAIQATMWPWYWFRELGPVGAGLVTGGVWMVDGLRRAFGAKLAAWWRARRGGVASSEENP